jgi:hypothetical protein
MVAPVGGHHKVTLTYASFREIVDNRARIVAQARYPGQQDLNASVKIGLLHFPPDSLGEVGPYKIKKSWNEN